MKKFNYDSTLTCTEDLELWTRLATENQKIMILDECLLIYRLHDKQITETTRERQRTEVVAVQKRYYSELLDEMDGDIEKFYINGIYFRDSANVKEFCAFFKWLKAVNNKSGKIEKEALYYAMFEILAEYKRKGVSKAGIIKAMLSFGLPFLMKEIPARKKRAIIDGRKCIDSAAKIGLKQTGGSPEFPIFSQK